MRTVAVLVVLSLAARDTAHAEQVRTWAVGAADLAAARSDSVAVTSFGRLFLAPRVARLGAGEHAIEAAHVWAVATDARGNVFLGTGPDGRVVRIPPVGTPSVLWSAPEPMVSALASLPSGDLLAATVPGGKIYRIRPEGKAEVWCETGERYVWSMAATPDGTVFAGTGDRGIVLRVGPSGHAETLFDSDEAHFTALLPREDGSLLAGGADRGVVYRIDPGGSASVLLDGDMDEVADLAADADGSVVAALLASPESDPQPPALRIQLPQGDPIGARPDAAAQAEERDNPTLQAIIEGLAPQGDPRPSPRLRGKVVRIAKGGAVAELWRSSAEAPLCVAIDDERRVLFGTGEPARLYRIDSGGEAALLATLREAQVTVLLGSGAAYFAATSNPAGVYRVERRAPESGSLVSRPFDALVPSRWGAVRWRVENAGPGNAEFEARTGNRANPDDTWSPWGPAVTAASGGDLHVPDGRFLQLRARLAGDGATRSRVADVSVSYAPHNRPPAVESFRTETGADAVASSATFRYRVADPDGDAAAVEVQYRSVGGADWKTATAAALPGASDGAESAGAWRDGKAIWNVSEVPEGEYELRAVATDDSANPPGEGRRHATEPPVVVSVDRTLPNVEMRRLGDGLLEIVVADPASGVRRLEILEGDRALFSARPVDGICDSRRETFRIAANDAGAGPSRRVRAVDAAGNATVLDVPPR